MVRSSSRKHNRNNRSNRQKRNTLRKRTHSKRLSGNKKRQNRTTRRMKRGGGFMTGAMSAARQALLPFLAYTAQKSVQRRVKNKKQ